MSGTSKTFLNKNLAEKKLKQNYLLGSTTLTPKLYNQISTTQKACWKSIINMKINGVPYRTIWLADDQSTVEIIDQTKLPHEFRIEKLYSVFLAANARKNMFYKGGQIKAWGANLEGSPITTPTTGDQITGAEHHSEHRLNTKPNTAQIRTIRRSPNPNTASEHKNSLITAQRMPNTGRTQAV